MPDIKRLSKSDLLKKRDRVYEEDYFIDLPDYEGSVRIRSVATDTEFENIMNTIEREKAINGATGIRRSDGTYKIFTEKQIYYAVFVTACLVDPDIELHEAYDMLESIGPVMPMIANRICAISGLTSGMKGEDVAEEKLKADPFSSSDSVNLLRDSSQTPFGSEPDSDGVNGNQSVVEHQA